MLQIFLCTFRKMSNKSLLFKHFKYKLNSKEWEYKVDIQMMVCKSCSFHFNLCPIKYIAFF